MGLGREGRGLGKEDREGEGRGIKAYTTIFIDSKILRKIEFPLKIF
jgi:hypothetical protein